ncbi:nitrite/sulfite reductase [Devosia limi]|nr:nitrite/sulfite reductase [Devosia limi]SHE52309.1 precorrin-3B synthase [Devosia limi DSM 17137]
MQTGDGLLARLRPVGGELTPEQLAGIAGLAGRYGNGLVEVTARGNLQVRGLRAESVPEFASAVESVVAIETGIPIEIGPLSGLDPDERGDALAMAAMVRQGSAGLQARLGPKVTVVIDSAAGSGLAALAADVRLVAIDRDNWRIGLAKTPLGIVATEDAAGAVTAWLALIAELGRQARGRTVPVDAARAAVAGMVRADDDFVAGTALPRTITALKDGRCAARVTLSFGAADGVALARLAEAARARGIDEFKLAPDHCLLGLTQDETAARGFLADAAGLGLITAERDGRLKISACIGSAGCASGLVPARVVAGRLAALEQELFDGSFELHVSGCAKGCAHPRAALLTLVGGEVGCGLVIGATAGDKPLAQFGADAIEPVIMQLAGLWRDNRALGETVAACFKRLGDAAIVAAVRQG